MIQVSSPGKIHLIGEHTSVYGKGAILASINLYLHAEISKSKTKKILGLVQYDDAIKNMQSAIEAKIIEKFQSKIPNYIADGPRLICGYKIKIDKSGITVGSGLGTSASLSAAFSECLLKFLKIDYTNDDLFEIAFEGEKIFHGDPSGGDLAAIINRGLTFFKKNSDGTKTITPLSLNKDLSLLLIDSGKPVERTSDMVTQVKEKLKKQKAKIEKVFDSQNELTNQMIGILKVWDEEKFINILKAAEKNLEKLGVVGKKAKTIISKIEKLGGAAKITGAGGIKKGSGMILAFHKDLNELIKFAKANNLKYYSVEISPKGVKY